MALNHYKMDLTKALGAQLRNYLERLDADLRGVQSLFAAMSQQKTTLGTLTTRTSDTVGTVTASGTDHQVATGMLVELTWSGGTRSNVVVGTVAGASIPFSGGTGANLPTQDTAVTVEQYLAVAQYFGYCLSDGTTLDEAVAQNAYNEINSMLGNGAPSIQQCAARHRQ